MTMRLWEIFEAIGQRHMNPVLLWIAMCGIFLGLAVNPANDRSADNA